MSPLTVLTVVVCLGAYTHVSGMCPQNCSCLGGYHIDTINCNHNGLTNVPNFQTREIHADLVRLQGNSITTIYAGAFSSIPNLRFLYLQHNKINALHDGAFSNLPLVHLHLQINEINALPDGIFRNLVKLTNLRLEENRITTLPRNVFYSQTAVSTLWLQNNQINALPDGVFRNLVRLRMLRLDGNRITTLPRDVFTNLQHLKIFYMMNNRIQYIPYGVFEANSRNLTIYSQGNPISEGSQCINVNDWPRLFPAYDTVLWKLSVQCSNSYPICVSDANGNIASDCVDVQTLTSNTTHGGLVVKYTRDNYTVLPAAAKCPDTMHGRELCKDQFGNGKWYKNCSLYCQPTQCTYSTFKTNFLGEERCINTMMYIANLHFVFSYVSHDKSAVDICTRVHANLLHQGDYWSPHRHPKLRAAINQFSASIYRYYIRTRNGYQDLQSFPDIAQRPAAILCYDRCPYIDSKSDIGAVTVRGSYSCKGNKVPIVAQARAECRKQKWYGDCIDRSAGLDPHVDIIWSLGEYNCTHNLVPAEQDCIAHRGVDGTFAAKCVTKAKYTALNHGAIQQCRSLDIIASL